MKKVIFAVLFFAVALSTFAQEKAEKPQMKTLFGNNDRIKHGGYGGILINYSQIDGKDAVLVGARGGWIIDHHFVIGVGGMGFASQINYKNPTEPDEKYVLGGGYGGLVFEPILSPFNVVNVSFPVLVGAGGASYTKYYDNGNYEDHNWESYDASAFFVVEPGVEINLNLVKFMRVSFGGYYRYTSGLNLENPYTLESKESLLNGFSCGVGLKFGKF
jgi:hypothetical protein